MEPTKEYSQFDMTEGYSSENPPHVNITREPPGTPWDVRLGLTLLPARYLARSIIQSLTNTDTPTFLRRLTGLDFFAERESKQVINSINDFYKSSIPEIENALGKPGVQSGQRFVPSGNDIYEKLNPVLGDKNRALHKRMGIFSSSTANNSLEWAVKEHYKYDDIRLTRESQGNVRGAIAANQFDTVYHNSLAAGSLAMSYIIRKNVLKEMQSVYSEAVGYELGKDAEEVTTDDIFDSKNQIIQSTAINFKHNQWKRFGISLLPLLKNFRPARFANTGDLAVGAWAGMWAYDVWGRDQSMLETFHNFIKDKLNPLSGIGDQIHASDMLNIYQHYAFKFHPDRAFRAVSSPDSDDSRMWADSEKIFMRLADLMNDSYNFKHEVAHDKETGLPKALANFTMPKLIYLLGHDRINARQPEWSMAFIEIANRFGMEAVKEVEHERDRGTHLSDVLKKYPVNLKATRVRFVHPSLDEMLHSAEPERTVLAEKESVSTAASHPSTHIAAHEADHARLTPVVAAQESRV